MSGIPYLAPKFNLEASVLQKVLAFCIHKDEEARYWLKSIFRLHAPVIWSFLRGNFLAMTLIDEAVALAHSVSGEPRECPALLPIEKAKQQTGSFRVSQSTVIYGAFAL